MARTVRSAKGVMLDFDTLDIKKQLASAPPPVDVKLRQNFIENRLKRRTKKAAVVAAVEVAPDLPAPVEELPEPLVVIQEPMAVEAVDEVEDTPATKPVTKQRARKKAPAAEKE